MVHTSCPFKREFCVIFREVRLPRMYVKVDLDHMRISQIYDQTSKQERIDVTL